MPRPVSNSVSLPRFDNPQGVSDNPQTMGGLFSGNKRHTKVLKLSAGLRTHPAECSKLGKTQIIKDAGRGMVRNTGFCDQNTSRSCIRNLSRSFVLHTTVRDDVSPTTAVRRLPLLRAADTAAALPLLLRAP